MLFDAAGGQRIVYKCVAVCKEIIYVFCPANVGIFSKIVIVLGHFVGNHAMIYIMRQTFFYHFVRIVDMQYGIKFF